MCTEQNQTRLSPRRQSSRLDPAMLLCLAFALMVAIAAARAQTATETVLHSFANFPYGANPYAPLLLTADGNLYGTTCQGGPANQGVAFKLGASGRQTALYNFTPLRWVVRNSAGEIYGTTYGGGTANAGVVYEIDASGHQKVLHSFTGGADGAHPYAGVILDSSGNLYGTTYAGGSTNCSGGCGVVFKIDPSGNETVLHSLMGAPDGANPYAGLISDPACNLYGTTSRGGGNITGSGMVVQTGCGRSGGDPAQLSGQHRPVPYCTHSILVPIQPRRRAGWSATRRATSTELRNTAARRTWARCTKLDTAGNLTALYWFPGAGTNLLPDGPNSGVIRDSAGDLYGPPPMAAWVAWSTSWTRRARQRRSTAFRLPPAGPSPSGGTTLDAAGNLYGTTQLGGPANAGILYKIDPTGSGTVLYSFTGGADGADPDLAIGPERP